MDAIRSENWLIDLFTQIAKEEFCFAVNVPVRINNRVTRYIGRTISTMEEDNYKCLGFDFNKIILEEQYPIDKVLNTIKHELVHWYTDKTNNRHCRHDKNFIENCYKFGVKDTTDFQRYKPCVPLLKEQYHEARCRGCDRVVAKCKNVNNLWKFMNRCGGTVCNCGSAERYVTYKGVTRYYYHANPLLQENGQTQSWLECDWVLKDLKIILCKENSCNASAHNCRIE